MNAEQEISKTVRVFGRLGWNEGQNESFAYTEVDQAVEIGGDWRPDRWRRSNDKLGIAFITNGISRLHQLYLALGGNGFLLGDGRLTYGREDIVETYYNAQLWRGVYFSPERTVGGSSWIQQRPRAGGCPRAQASCGTLKAETRAEPLQLRGKESLPNS